MDEYECLKAARDSGNSRVSRVLTKMVRGNR
jgi:hypothetical protein